MPDLLIRDVTPEVMERLKAQAAAKGHSMQVEAKSIIEDAVQLSIEDWVAMVKRSSADLDLKHGAAGASSAELIREGREERDRSIDEAVVRRDDAFDDGGHDE